MRLPVFAILALVATGCTIHVVEQPATPMLVAAASTPPYAPHRLTPRRVAYEPAAAAAAPTPAPAPPRAKPPTVEPTRPARPTRVPFKTLAPEPRNTHLAAVAPPTRKRRPQKVKRPEPLATLSSASVTKAQ